MEPPEAPTDGRKANLSKEGGIYSLRNDHQNVPFLFLGDTQYYSDCPQFYHGWHSILFSSSLPFTFQHKMTQLLLFMIKKTCKEKAVLRLTKDSSLVPILLWGLAVLLLNLFGFLVNRLRRRRFSMKIDIREIFWVDIAEACIEVSDE